MSNIALSLANISRTYVQGGNALPVLNQLNLQLHAGEVVALVGPSGSGKSTLLQIAGLLDTPGGGDVVISGQVMNGASQAKRTLARRKYIGFVYQFHHLLPEFSALENVVLPQMIAGLPVAAAEAKAKELLGEMGLSARLHHRPSALSGGEQQRVAIARALANSAALLLADEPTGNLDTQTTEEVLAVFGQLNREAGLTIVVVTHEPDVAAHARRLVRLKDGRVVFDGASAQGLQEPHP